jgi:predicted P-loop ATPase
MEALERDRDQLWAEAAQREANGASIVLPKHLWAVAGLEQANRQITDPWVDEISDYLETEKLLRVHTRTLLYDVLKLIGAQANSAAAKRVSGVMKTIGGWTPKHGLRIETRSAAGYEKEE